jgi:hypothetical protein
MEENSNKLLSFLATNKLNSLYNKYDILNQMALGRIQNTGNQPNVLSSDVANIK